MSGLHQYQHSEHVSSKMNGVNHKQNLTERDNFIDKRSASTSLLPSTIDMMTNSNGMPNKKSPSQRSVQSLRSVSQYSNHNHLRNHTDPSSSVSLLDRSLVSLLKYVLLELEKLITMLQIFLITGLNYNFVSFQAPSNGNTVIFSME